MIKQEYIKNIVDISIYLTSKIDIMFHQLDAIQKSKAFSREDIEATRVLLFKSQSCIKFFQSNVLRDTIAVDYEFSKFVELEKPLPAIIMSSIEHLVIAIEDIYQFKASLGVDLEIINYETNPMKIHGMNTRLREIIDDINSNDTTRIMANALVKKSKEMLTSIKQVAFIKAFVLNECAISILK